MIKPDVNQTGGRPLWDIKGFDDLAVVIVLAGLAGVLHLVQDDVPHGWSLVARIAVVGLVLLALVGSGLAVARIAAAVPGRARRGPGRGGVAFVSVATALIGLATAIVNFLGAGL